MGKITERVSRPDDPIFREGLRMYSVRLPRRPGDPEVAEIYGPCRPPVTIGRPPGPAPGSLALRYSPSEVGKICWGRFPHQRPGKSPEAVRKIRREPPRD
jgi:hypothetical protein